MCVGGGGRGGGGVSINLQSSLIDMSIYNEYFGGTGPEQSLVLFLFSTLLCFYETLLFACMLFVVCRFFAKSTFLKNSFRITIRVGKESKQEYILTDFKNTTLG